MDPLNSGFVRNRRFLLLVSVGLASINILGLNFTKITFLGNEANITDSSWVYVIAWTIWCWALAQYIVWFRDVGAWKDVLTSVDRRTSEAIGREVAERDPPTWARMELERSIVQQLTAFPTAREKVQYLRRYAPVPLEQSRRNPRTVNINIKASALLPDDRGYVDSADTIRYEVPVSDEDWDKRWFRSFLWVLVTQRFTLEYFAPFAIALLPVAIEVQRRWL